mgnify:CR=1 FL=1
MLPSMSTLSCQVSGCTVDTAPAFDTTTVRSVVHYTPVEGFFGGIAKGIGKLSVGVAKGLAKLGKMGAKALGNVVVKGAKLAEKVGAAGVKLVIKDSVILAKAGGKMALKEGKAIVKSGEKLALKGAKLALKEGKALAKSGESSQEAELDGAIRDSIANGPTSIRHMDHTNGDEDTQEKPGTSHDRYVYVNGQRYTHDPAVEVGPATGTMDGPATGTTDAISVHVTTLGDTTHAILHRNDGQPLYKTADEHVGAVVLTHVKSEGLILHEYEQHPYLHGRKMDDTVLLAEVLRQPSGRILQAAHLESQIPTGSGLTAINTALQHHFVL